jgi:cation transport ATPase
MMVTGDNWDTAMTIARELGIERTSVYAESLPKDKANIIKEIQVCLAPCNPLWFSSLE